MALEQNNGQMVGTDLLDEARKINQEEDKKACTKFLSIELTNLEQHRINLQVEEERFQNYCDMSIDELSKIVYNLNGGRRNR